jgi:hypothetical protein
MLSNFRVEREANNNLSMWKEVMANRQTEVPTYATMEFSLTSGLSVRLTTPQHVEGGDGQEANRSSHICNNEILCNFRVERGANNNLSM